MECSRAKLFIKLYSEIMKFVCLIGNQGGDRENILDVQDRIKFIIKAEGALSKHHELMKDEIYAKSVKLSQSSSLLYP